MAAGHRLRAAGRVVLLALVASLLLLAPEAGPARAAVPAPVASAPAPAPAADLALAARAATEACAQDGDPGGCALLGADRQELGDGVVEWTYLLRVGSGRHDVVRVHRVVAEGRPGSAGGAGRAVFLVHGDVWGFDAVFGGEQGTDRRAPNVATFLARRGLDVWGIDLRWVLVPATVTDTSFMREWGFASDLRDLRVATTLQRGIRAATGSGTGRTALLGWSRGGQLAYAYAGAESQRPPLTRNVDALVPADTTFHFGKADEVYRQGLCRAYRDDRGAQAAGETAYSLSFFRQAGRAALTAPHADSALSPGLTNRQLALAVGTAVNGVFNAGFHFVAGRQTDDGVTRALTYTSEERWARLMSRAAPWEDIGEFVDGEAVFCGTVPVPFDDHLAAVTVPVLSLSAAGGFDDTGRSSTALLGSRDVTHLVVRLRPPGHETADVGHVDLWTADDAGELVWAPLLTWLRRH